MLRDIEKNTVDFVPNYKESTTEPSVLPAGLPELLMNGSTGIAVGMTTNIPPHNLGELVDAIEIMIDNPSITVDELISTIPGPDFPTGGAIMGREGVDRYLKTGRGLFKVRGTAHIEDLKQGKEQIVITEIPYYVNRSNLVAKIADLSHQKVIPGISDLRDESDENTRIVIELKRGEVPRVVLNKLYKHTPFESSFGAILLALHRNRPKQMNIKEMLLCYIDHRREIVYRRTAFQLKKAENRAHILEGYKIALTNLDDFVRIIRASANRDEARTRLRGRYPLTVRQTDAILDLRLYQLTGMEREKIEREYIELMKLINELKSILESETKLLGIIKKELIELKEKYADARRTQILAAEGELRMEDLIVNEGCIITVTHNGFIKRTAVSSYRSQHRGGKGVIGTGSHDEDFVEHLFTASTHDYIMFFMNNGRVYVEKVYDIPEGTRVSKGRAVVNLLEMQKKERVASMICVTEFAEEKHLVMCTLKGIVKKTNLKDYRNYRRGGIIGINIDSDDQLIGTRLTSGDNELVIITQRGMSIRFRESDMRDQGRATRGVKGISLKGNDLVETFEVVDQNATLLIAGENGQGKRTAFDAYRLQSRAGSGVIAIRSARVAGALSVREGDEVMMLTQSGQAVRSPVKDIRVIGRTTQGVRLINLAKRDKLIGICKVIEVEEAEA